MKCATRASMMYSFIATCKANDVDPRTWFEDVIRRIPDRFTFWDSIQK